MEHTYCVIMAGGKGERFWPLSTKQTPKPFIKLIGERTMLQMTVERAVKLVPEDRIVVVLGEEHYDLARRQLAGFRPDQFVVEPAGRDTAPCIGLTASILRRKDADALMMVLPADHYIPDADAFARTMALGIKCARSGPFLVTAGIRPTRPEVGYGYMKAGEPVPSFSGEACCRVHRFVEKPDHETALRYLSEGTYYWNSGIFLWQARVVLEDMARYMPGLYPGLVSLEEAMAQHDTERAGTLFKGLPRISIDYGLMEKADNVLMVKAEFQWDDVGTWSALSRVMDTDVNGNYLRGNTVCVDTKDCVIYGDGITVGAVGVSRLIIAASREGVLVCDIERDQDTRQIAKIVGDKKAEDQEE